MHYLKKIIVGQKAFLLLVVLSLFSTFSFAQITADVIEGCVPLEVNFSIPPGHTNDAWNFADGGSSNSPSPVSRIFITPGTYNVTYTGTLGGAAKNYNIIIKVYANPVASFTVAPAGTCLGNSITFTDASVGGGGSAIVKRSYDFGDGTTDTINKNPTHTYGASKTYPTSIIVTDANGCKNFFKLPTDIKIIPGPPVANFTSSPPQSCTAPANVTFTNTSTANSGGALSSSWDFGNGTTSTATNPPAVTYNATGSYAVKLTVTEAGGCSATKNYTFVVGKPTADFTFPKDSVCPNTNVLFTSTSTGATTYSWSFDGAAGVAGSTTTKAFATPGIHTIKLTANAPGCSDTITKTIFVEGVTAAFTKTITNPCAFPKCLDYTNTSSANVVKWNWVFGDGKTDTLASPNHCFVRPDDSPYTIYDVAKYYNSSLTVTSALGCSATVNFADTLYPITARFMPDTTMGCVPLTVNFSDSSRSKDPITKWNWRFGDGGTSTDTNPTHVFVTPGEYAVYLDITNSNGCIDTSYAIVIKVGDVTDPTFSLSSVSVCPYEEVTLSDLTPDDSVDSWNYKVDGALISACPDDPNPKYVFTDKTGFQEITLITGFNGCFTSKTVANAVEVKGPITRLNYQSTCDSSLKYQFNGEIWDADTWTWYFGDGDSLITSTADTVIHYYSASGDYWAKIIGHNNTSGCNDFRDSVLVKVREVKAAFTTNESNCNGKSHSFDASASTDVFSACLNGYRWDYGDGTPPDLTSSPNISHTYSSKGEKDARLIVTDENGCKDTSIFTLKIYDLTVDFTIANPIPPCLPLPVDFKDITVSDTLLARWIWTFGDGTGHADKDSLVSHTYAKGSGASFNVTLTVQDTLGCINSRTKTVIPDIPNPAFTNTAFACTETDATFTGSGVAGYTYTWDFGDGTTSAALGTISTTHKYSNPGPYDVQLIVKDVAGCLDTLKKVAAVTVQEKPVASFTSDQDGISPLCLPASINFTSNSTSSGTISTYTWDDGIVVTSGASSTRSANYGTPDKYAVKLSVTTSAPYGCVDDTIRIFDVVGPQGDFDVFPNSIICIGDSVTFTLKASDTSNVDTWSWSFEGATINGGSPIKRRVTYYPPGGENTVILTLKSANDCKYSPPFKTIKMHEAYARFGVDTSLCDGELVALTDSSGGADSWNWTINPGNQTYSVQNPAPLKLAVGDYTVSLNIKDNASGCVDTTEQTVHIHPLPTFTTNDVALCSGTSTKISATSKAGYKYSWTPTTDLLHADSSVTTATPTKTTIYTVTVTDSNSCVAAKATTATVYGQLFFENNDTCVIIGQSTNIGMNLGDAYTYDWTSGDTKNLSCTDCPIAKVTVLEDGVYKLIMTDTLKCFPSTKIYNVCVRKEYTLDVPTAFTPNGDGSNDLVFVEGWGISKLIVFRIFNRWGEIIFESTDIHQGWDGTYKGQPQNMESYVYYAEVEFFDGSKGSKSGSLTVIR